MWTKQTLIFDGAPRSWLLVEPSLRDKSAPAFIFLHGLDGPDLSGQTLGQYKFIAAFARKLGFIAAFPRGSIGALPEQPDSLGWGPVAEHSNRRFVREVAAALVREYGANPSKLVLGGFSNGAFAAANEVTRERSPFSAFFLSAGGAPVANAIAGARPRVYVEIGVGDKYQLSIVRSLIDHLRLSGWAEGKTLHSVQHQGGHDLYAANFEQIWRFLTRRRRASSTRQFP